MKSKSKYKNRIHVVPAEKVITNHWIADKMGVTNMAVSCWITNKIQPSMSQFGELSNLLQVNI